jgi:hypothetical protein
VAEADDFFVVDDQDSGLVGHFVFLALRLFA